MFRQAQQQLPSSFSSQQQPQASSTSFQCVRFVQEAHKGAVNAVRFSNNGQHAMTCSSDRRIKLWNPHRSSDPNNDANGMLMIKEYLGHGQDVMDVAIQTDNSKFASCSLDKQIFLWDIPTGNILRKYREHRGAVNALCFAPAPPGTESQLLISASYDRTVRVWDQRSRDFKPIQTLEDAKDSVTSVCMHDCSIFAASVDGCIRTYDIRNGKLVVDHIGTSVSCVRSTSDGNCYLAATLDDTLRLFDRSTGEMLNDYRGHTNKHYKLECCLSHDDSLVLMGSEERDKQTLKHVVLVWDLIEQRIVDRVQTQHSRAICALTYLPQQKQSISGTSRHCFLAAAYDGSLALYERGGGSQSSVSAARNTLASIRYDLDAIQ